MARATLFAEGARRVALTDDAQTLESDGATRWIHVHVARAMADRASRLSLDLLLSRVRALVDLLNDPARIKGRFIAGFNTREDVGAGELLALIGAPALARSKSARALFTALADGSGDYDDPDTYPAAAPVRYSAPASLSTWSDLLDLLEARRASEFGTMLGALGHLFQDSGIDVLEGRIVELQGTGGGLYFAQRNADPEWDTIEVIEVMDLRDRSLWTIESTDSPVAVNTAEPEQSAACTLEVYYVALDHERILDRGNATGGIRTANGERYMMREAVRQIAALYETGAHSHLLARTPDASVPAVAAIYRYEAPLRNGPLYLPGSDKPFLTKLARNDRDAPVFWELAHIKLTVKLPPEPPLPPPLQVHESPLRYELPPVGEESYYQVLQWHVPESEHDTDADWIRPVALNRMRMMRALTLTGWSSDSSSDAAQLGLLRIAGGHDGLLPVDGIRDLVLLPELLERQPLILANGALNQRWLIEVYASMQGTPGWGAAVRSVIHSSDRRLAWYLWWTRRLGHRESADERPIDSGLRDAIETSDDVDLTRAVRSLALVRPLAFVRPGVTVPTPPAPPVTAPPATTTTPATTVSTAPTLPVVSGAKPAAVPAAKPAVVPPPAAKKKKRASPLLDRLLELSVTDEAQLTDARRYDKQGRREQRWFSKQVNALTARYAKLWAIYGQIDRITALLGPEIKLLNEITAYNGSIPRLTLDKALAPPVLDAKKHEAILGSILELIIRAEAYPTEFRAAYTRYRGDPVTERVNAYREILKENAELVPLSNALADVRHTKTAEVVRSLAKNEDTRTTFGPLLAEVDQWEHTRARISAQLERIDAGPPSRTPSSYAETVVNSAETAAGGPHWTLDSRLDEVVKSLVQLWDIEDIDAHVQREIETTHATWKRLVKTIVDAELASLVRVYNRGANELGLVAVGYVGQLLYEPQVAEPGKTLLVPSYTPDPKYSQGALDRIISDARKEPSASRTVFDLIRGSSASMQGVRAAAAVGAPTWDEIATRFAQVRPHAERLDDLVEALFGAIYESSGWCSYARSRHWRYDTADTRLAPITEAIKLWRRSTPWASKDDDAPSRLPRAEINALGALEQCFNDAMNAALDDPTTKGESTIRDGTRLRFVMLGSTLEDAWKRLEKDARLYRAILDNLFPSSQLPAEITAVSFVEWFRSASHALVPTDASIFIKLQTTIRTKILESLPQIGTFGSVRPPADWWSGESTMLAYGERRSSALLMPQPGLQDDFAGATVACVEFFSLDGEDSATWRRWNARNSKTGDASARAEAQLAKDSARRPQAVDIERAAIERAAARHRRTKIGNATDALVFGQLASKVWFDAARRSIALARTFTLLDLGSERVGLYREVPPGKLADHWHFANRASTASAEDLTAQGVALAKAVSAEAGLIASRFVELDAGGASLYLRRKPADATLFDVIVTTLLKTLDASPPRDSVALLARFLYQASSVATRDAVPDPSAASQWTWMASVLSATALEASVEATERSAEARLSRPSTISLMFGAMQRYAARVHGPTNSLAGTRIATERFPKGYLPLEIGIAELSASGTPRVLWPLHMALSVGKALARRDDPLLYADLVSFLTTLMVESPYPDCPFFVAAAPGAPDDVHVGAFSSAALVDYAIASNLRVGLDRIDKGLRDFFVSAENYGSIKAFWRALTVHCTRLMSIAEALPGEGAIAVGAWALESRRLGVSVLQRGPASLIGGPADPSTRVWRDVSPWMRSTTGFPMDFTVDTKASRDASYLEVLYPVTGSGAEVPRADPSITGDVATVHYVRIASALNLASEPKPPVERTDETTMMGHLNAGDEPVLLVERLVLIEWARRLRALDAKRRNSASYVSIFNTARNLLEACQTRGSLAARAAVDSLLQARRALEAQWDEARRRINLQYVSKLSGRLGKKSVLNAEPQFRTRMDAWRAEWDVALEKRFNEAKAKIEALFSKSAAAEDEEEEGDRAEDYDASTLAKAEAIVSKFREADEPDQRLRIGIYVLMQGMALSAKERGFEARVEARAAAQKPFGRRWKPPADAAAAVTTTTAAPAPS